MSAPDDKGVRRRYPWNFMGSDGSEPWSAGLHGRPEDNRDLGAPSAIPRRLCRIPVTSESTALSQVISCYHPRSGALTHSGQLSLIVRVCAGLPARPAERRSLIVSSKSAGARSVKMFATQISSGQPSLNSCEEVPIDQITRPAEPAQINQVNIAQSDQPSSDGRRGSLGLSEPEFVCV